MSALLLGPEIILIHDGLLPCSSNRLMCCMACVILGTILLFGMIATWALGSKLTDLAFPLSLKSTTEADSAKVMSEKVIPISAFSANSIFFCPIEGYHM